MISNLELLRKKPPVHGLNGEPLELWTSHLRYSLASFCHALEASITILIWELSWNKRSVCPPSPAPLVPLEPVLSNYSFLWHEEQPEAKARHNSAEQLLKPTGMAVHFEAGVVLGNIIQSSTSEFRQENEYVFVCLIVCLYVCVRECLFHSTLPAYWRKYEQYNYRI